MNVFESTVISALDQQAKAQELFQATVLLELGVIKDKLQKIKAVKGIALDPEQALKELAEAEDTELFLSWCEKSKAIERQILEAGQAIESFWDELEATSTEKTLLTEAKNNFIEDNVRISGQLMGAADMLPNYRSTRRDLREEFGLPPED